MAVAYTTLNDVKALLLSRESTNRGGRRLDFSENYRDLRADPGNNNGSPLTGRQLDRIAFVDGFSGYYDFELLFTSATTFSVSVTPVGNEVSIPLGTGDVSTTFTAIDPDSALTWFTIPSSAWSGAAALTGDRFTWRSESVMSNDQATAHIIDAEILVDGWILASQRMTLSDVTKRLFEASPPVPPQIAVAAKYLAAFMIWEVATDKPSANLAESPVFQWWQLAKNVTKLYIDSIPKYAPLFHTRPPVIPSHLKDKAGVPTLGPDNYTYGKLTTIEDVAKRLRDYRDGFVYTPSNFTHEPANA